MTVSATIPDWSREIPSRLWDPSYRLLRTIRKYQISQSRTTRKYWALQYRFWSIVTQSEIHLTQAIGGGLLLPHPNGIVMHPDAVIGPNCLIFQQVTLGTISTQPGAPILGGHVDVGSGAKILGPVTIGDHAKVGANAVVLCDVPAGATAVGIPARIIPTRDDLRP